MTAGPSRSTTGAVPVGPRARARRVLMVGTVAAVVTASTVGASAAARAPGAPLVPVPQRPLAERVVDAERARWDGPARALLTSHEADARALARAAVRAARAAASATSAVTEGEPAALRSSLLAAGAELEGLVAQSTPAHAVLPGAALPDGPGAATTGADVTPVERLAVVDALRRAADEVYSLAFRVEAAAETVADEGAARPSALPDVEAGIAAATAAASQVASLPDLEPIEVVLDDESEVWARPEVLVGVPSSPWPNGAIPLDELCAPTAAAAALLRCDAARAFDALAARYLQETGRPLTLVSSYRSFEQQIEVKRLRGALAAPPGKSFHGLGVAIDLADAGGVGQFDRPVYLWMTENAADFGWYHPAAMGPGGSGPQEPWHWEFAGLPAGAEVPDSLPVVLSVVPDLSVGDLPTLTARR